LIGTTPVERNHASSAAKGSAKIGSMPGPSTTRPASKIERRELALEQQVVERRSKSRADVRRKRRASHRLGRSGDPGDPTGIETEVV
jgi:hypothetical protein